MTISEISVRHEEEQPTAVIRHRVPVDETSRIPEWIQQTLAAIQAQGEGEGPAGLWCPAGGARSRRMRNRDRPGRGENSPSFPAGRGTAAARATS